MRIVSLLPSATEIVCALGLTESLVGISHDCDYPPEIRSRPALSAAIVTADLPSPLIDTRIRDQVHRGTSVYHLDERHLADLRPDLILTQELCAVCAPSYTLVQQAAKILDAEALVLMPCGFDIRRARQEIHLLAERPGWETLPAVRSGRVYLTDATSYFSRPGPRIVTGLEILAQILHPEVVRVPLPPGAVEPL